MKRLLSATAIVVAGIWFAAPDAHAGPTLGDIVDVTGYALPDNASFNSVTTNGSSTFISFASVSGKLYRAEYSDSLSTPVWHTLSDNIAGTGGALSVIDNAVPAGTRQRFYRVRLLP